VIVYNRTRSRTDELKSLDAEVADTIAEACRSEVVITVLADDTAMENIAFESGEFFSSFPASGIHISASTISVSMAKRLAKGHAERGGQFIAAPIIGRPEMVASRQISLLVAGDRSTYERCLPALDAISRNVRLVSETPWHANLLKLCANFLLLSAVETLAEIFAVLPTQGVAPPLFLDLMSETLFTVPFYQSYGRRMISGEFLSAGFKLGLARKDSLLLSEILTECGIRLPISDVLQTRLEAAVSRGYKDHDTAALALTMQQDCEARWGSHCAVLKQLL
jgi:3-hydroxyisobutyrate dehydrogenase-like beta-hydroxyacid dehydrogenase